MSSLKDDCSVCLSPLMSAPTGSGEQGVLCTPCGHAFHAHCLRRWCIRGQPGTCPLCRRQMQLSDAIPLVLNVRLGCLKRHAISFLSVLLLFVTLVGGASIIAEVFRFKYQYELWILARLVEVLTFVILAGFFLGLYCDSGNPQENRHLLVMAFLYTGFAVALSGYLVWKYFWEDGHHEKVK